MGHWRGVAEVGSKSLEVDNEITLFLCQCLSLMSDIDRDMSTSSSEFGYTLGPDRVKLYFQKSWKTTRLAGSTALYLYSIIGVLLYLFAEALTVVDYVLPGSSSIPSLKPPEATLFIAYIFYLSYSASTRCCESVVANACCLKAASASRSA